MRNKSRPHPHICSHMTPWLPLSLFSDALGAKGVSYANRERAYLDSCSRRNDRYSVSSCPDIMGLSLLCPAGVKKKITLVSSFHLESLFAVQVLLPKELLEKLLISVTLSQRRRCSDLARLPKLEHLHTHMHTIAVLACKAMRSLLGFISTSSPLTN